MNRVIKFRAWDATNSRMVYDEFYIHQKTGTCFYLNDNDTTGEPLYDCGEEEPTLMQFTGLNDKWGKEIYEGDIVESDHSPLGKPSRITRVIVYHNGAFRTQRSKGSSATRFNSLFPQKIYKTNLKVIGNIFQNPELINKL